MTGYGTSRHFAPTQYFGRFRGEADMNPIYEHAPYSSTSRATFVVNVSSLYSRAWTGSAIDRTAGRVSEIGRLSRVFDRRSGRRRFAASPLIAVQSRNCRVAVRSMARCDHRKPTPHHDTANLTAK